MIEPTREQWVAVHFLADYYGCVRVETTYRPPTMLKVSGGDPVQCRWFVCEDGRVNYAWDPDGALDEYVEMLVVDAKETVSGRNDDPNGVRMFGGWNH